MIRIEVKSPIKSFEQMVKTNFYTAIVCLIIGFLYLVAIPYQAYNICFLGMKDDPVITARTLPYIVVIVFMSVSIILLVQSVRNLKIIRNKNVKQENVDKQTIGITKSEFLGAVITYFYLLIYVIIMGYSGYLLTTPLFIFVIMLAFGYRKWLKMIILSIITTMILFYGFTDFINVPLPPGIFFG